MTDYSKFPQLHEFLSYIPYPIISWNEVITTYPSICHCYWSIIFAVFAASIQLTVYLISAVLAPRLIGYDKYPPLPSNSKISLSSYYLKLGQYVQYKRHIKIPQYDMKYLSQKYCDSKITALEISRWFVACNEFHANNRLQRKKFQEYLFPILTKIISLSFGMYAVYDKQWVYDRSLFYKGWPNKQQLDCCIPDIKVLYLCQMGFYIYRIFSALFIDRQLKDFIPTLIHHFVSFILLVLSYYNGLIRVGVVILLLHDPADIVLQCAKFFKLIKMEILCNFFFALLCVTWTATRIIIYPYHCVLSGLIDFWIQHPDCHGNIRYMAYSMIILMCILYCLHIHWFKLLIEAVIRILKGKGVVDGRSDSDLTDTENK